MKPSCIDEEYATPRCSGRWLGVRLDIDVLVDLDPQKPIGLFEYARIKVYIAEVLGGSADVVNRKTLKPLLRESILRDTINAF